MTDATRLLAEMTDRSREVFRRIVEEYLTTGEPVGSRTLTRTLSEKVSAATVRNVMQDLEYLGLLDSPHVSAGRMPTEMGLRMFVDGLLEVEDLNPQDRGALDASVGNGQPDVTAMLDRVSSALSGLTHGASLVLAPKREAPIRHIEFVGLSADRALVVLVFEDGTVENRIFAPGAGQTPSSMREAANFLNAVIQGKTLSEFRSEVTGHIQQRQAELNALARDLVQDGLAVWDGDEGATDRLIVRGRANLLDGGAGAEDLERIKSLFDDLERKRDIAEFLGRAEDADGVRIFIGSENRLFSLSGSSLVVSPYMNADRKVVGAVGVIGPTRLNYGRIVPIVDYTAQLVSRMMTDRA